MHERDGANCRDSNKGRLVARFKGIGCILRIGGISSGGHDLCFDGGAVPPDRFGFSRAHVSQWQLDLGTQSKACSPAQFSSTSLYPNQASGI